MSSSIAANGERDARRLAVAATDILPAANMSVGMASAEACQLHSIVAEGDGSVDVLIARLQWQLAAAGQLLGDSRSQLAQSAAAAAARETVLQQQKEAAKQEAQQKSVQLDTAQHSAERLNRELQEAQAELSRQKDAETSMRTELLTAQQEAADLKVQLARLPGLERELCLTREQHNSAIDAQLKVQKELDLAKEQLDLQCATTKNLQGKLDFSERARSQLVQAAQREATLQAAADQAAQQKAAAAQNAQEKAAQGSGHTYTCCCISRPRRWWQQKAVQRTLFGCALQRCWLNIVR